jgi:hypothetical protein
VVRDDDGQVADGYVDERGHAFWNALWAEMGEQNWHYPETLVGTIVVPLWEHRDTPRSMMSDACLLPITSTSTQSSLSAVTSPKLDCSKPCDAGTCNGFSRWFVAQYPQMSPVLVLWCPGQRGLRQGTLRIMPQMVHVLGTTFLGCFGNMETL